MSSKSLGVLVVVGLALLVAALLATRQGGEGDTVDGLLVPGLAERLNDVTQIDVIGPGEIPVASLRLGPAGWRVDEKNGYPADLGRIRQNLIALGDARIAEPKTSNPEFYDRLGVQELSSESATGVRVRVRAGDETLVDMIVGDTGVSGSYAYVRRTEQAQSWMVDADLDLEDSTAGWLDRELLSIGTDRIETVAISHRDGEELTIKKPEAGGSDFQVQDIPEGRELTYPGAANGIGGALLSLQLDDVYALEETTEVEPAVITVFQTLDGLKVTTRTWDLEEGKRVSFTAELQPELQDSSGEQAENAGDGDREDTPNPADDVESINSRLGSWAYVLPKFKTDQLTRRMDDLLRAEDES